VLRNYSSNFQNNYYTYNKTQPILTTGKLAAVGIYAGAALVGYRAGGPLGAAAAVMAVPEVITVPLLLG
jgi:hypothetical protein